MSHPYRTQPDRAFWTPAVAKLPVDQVDPVNTNGLSLRGGSGIATAGSCFSQNISRYLRAQGFNFLNTEAAPNRLPQKTADAFGYNMFSARYGNIYTSRQLLQLLDRAYGRFEPLDTVWVEPDGTCYDPFRPQITPGGYLTAEELAFDRIGHFAAVRAMCEQAEVFCFTLGLTETWMDRRDGAVYPLCPGVAAGQFDDTKHVLKNLEFEEVVADMSTAITRLREVNPKIKILLTVSPVGLMATATDQHVLTATAFSKSVLRVAAERLCRDIADVFYFPSYEIITGGFNGGCYLKPGGRDVSDEGVAHVMKLFFRHYYNVQIAPISPTQDATIYAQEAERQEDLVRTLCDEERLDRAD